MQISHFSAPSVPQELYPHLSLAGKLLGFSYLMAKLYLWRWWCYFWQAHTSHSERAEGELAASAVLWPLMVWVCHEQTSGVRVRNHEAEGESRAEEHRGWGRGWGQAWPECWGGVCSVLHLSESCCPQSHSPAQPQPTTDTPNPSRFPAQVIPRAWIPTGTEGREWGSRPEPGEGCCQWAAPA